MEDVEMTDEQPEDRKLQAYQNLDAAKAAFRKATAKDVPDDKKAELVAEAEQHAKQALRLADNDNEVMARANVRSARCHELQDKHCTALYEYKAARDQAGKSWSSSLQHRLLFCWRKTHPK